MGCDIHLYCEELKSINNEIKWISRDHFSLNPYFELWKGEKQYNIEPIFKRRDYEAFYALAGVRAYDKQNPKISGPRGLPEGICKVIQDEFEEWSLDAHSASYATLKEVYEYSLVPKNFMFGVNPLDDLLESMCERYAGPHSCDPLNFVKDCYENMPERLEKFRIVFWFDN